MARHECRNNTWELHYRLTSALTRDADAGGSHVPAVMAADGEREAFRRPRGRTFQSTFLRLLEGAVVARVWIARQVFNADQTADLCPFFARADGRATDLREIPCINTRSPLEVIANGKYKHAMDTCAVNPHSAFEIWAKIESSRNGGPLRPAAPRPRPLRQQQMP